MHLHIQYKYIYYIYSFIRVEKYRPNELNDLISHEGIIQTCMLLLSSSTHRKYVSYLMYFYLCASVTKFIDENKLPHLLFYGPPGTGKTSTILACSKRMYTSHEANIMVLEVRTIYKQLL